MSAGGTCMSNQLSMAEIASIESLSRSGHSNREIARLLCVDRGTVNKVVRISKTRESSSISGQDTMTGLPLETAAECQNRPNPQTGSAGPNVGFAGSEPAVRPVAEPNPQT